MIELAFITCLLVDPTRCEDHSLLFAEEPHLMGCMIHGQQVLANWIAAHPDERVASWKCRVSSTREVSL